MFGFAKANGTKTVPTAHNNFSFMVNNIGIVKRFEETLKCMKNIRSMNSRP